MRKGRNGPDRSFVKVPSLSQSLRPLIPGASLSSLHRTLWKPCSTLRPQSYQKAFSSFHLPETCNSHFTISSLAPCCSWSHSFLKSLYHHLNNTLEKRRNKIYAQDYVKARKMDIPLGRRFPSLMADLICCCLVKYETD